MSYVLYPMPLALCLMLLSFVLCPNALKIFLSYKISLSSELDLKVTHTRFVLNSFNTCCKQTQKLSLVLMKQEK